MKVCEFCGYSHNDVQRLRRPRPPVTRRAEDIAERRPPTYRILVYDLNKPRVNELQNFSADTISVVEAPDDLEFSVRINHYENDEIPMKLGRSISIPFVRFFLTTPKYPGSELKLMIGGEMGDFKFDTPDASQEKLVNDKTLATRRRDILHGYFQKVMIMEPRLWVACFVEVVGKESFLLEEIHVRETQTMVPEGTPGGSLRGTLDRIWYGWGEVGEGGSLLSMGRARRIKTVPFRSLHRNTEEPQILLHLSESNGRFFGPPSSRVYTGFFDLNGDVRVNNLPTPVIIDREMRWTFGFCTVGLFDLVTLLEVSFWGFKIPGRR